LFVKGSITLASSHGQEAHALARDGALTGLSIGYSPTSKSYDGGARVLAEVELFEASLVPVPMNDRTRVTAIKSITGPRDIAEMLQDAGLSSRRAKMAAGAAWKTINEQSDEEAADAELVALIRDATARLAQGGR
jgi:phage head maturation protease